MNKKPGRSRRRRARVPGIERVGPDRFRVRVRWTDSRGRRRKKEKVVPSYEQALIFREKVLAGDVPDGRVTRPRLGDYVERWLRENGHNLAPSSRETAAARLAHAVVEFGQLYIDRIEPGQIRRWLARSARDYSPSTVNGWLRILRQVLDAAAIDGHIESNPAKAVKPVRERRTTGRRAATLGPAECKRFLEAAREMKGSGELAEDIARLVEVAAWTGARLGELLALRWEDVAGDELRIERSVWRGREKATKTDDPRRVHLVEPAKRALAEQRAWLLESQHAGLGSGLCFPASPRHALAGARRRSSKVPNWHRAPSVLQKPLREIARRAEVPELSAHALRRSWENLSRLAGVDRMVRASLCGWRSEGAQAIYATVSDDERRAAGEAVLKLVEGEG